MNTDRLRTVQSDLDRKLAPVNLANQQLLSVPGPLQPLFPAGGMQRGWSVGFEGAGGWSLALALLAGSIGGAGGSGDVGRGQGGTVGQGSSPVGGDGWVAGVGLESLGLVAAEELGLPLDRIIMVEHPPAGQWPAVIAALVEVVDVVCLGEETPVGLRDARRLMARAREQGAVLFHLGGGRSWPQALDVTLSVKVGAWWGLGEGHGHLQSRSVTVTAVGRRSMAKPRSVSVLLPGPSGILAEDPAGVRAVRESTNPVSAGRSAGRVGSTLAQAG